jgi:phosphotransferase system HPr (HPr) family protein
MAIANAVTDADWRVAVRLDDRTANAGSVLELMALGAGQGTELTLESSGPDGEKALDALVALFGNNFGLPADD